MPRPLVRRVRTGLKVTVSTALLGWILHTIAQRDGLAAVGERLGALQTPWLVAALALPFAAVGLGVRRWGLLLQAQGLTVPTATLLRSFLVGRFVGAFTPSTTGLDVYRAVDIGRLTGEAGRSAGAVVVEKLVGLIGLSLLTFALLPAGADRFFGPAALAAAAAVGFGSALGLRLLRAPRLPSPLATRLPGALRERLERLATALTARPLGRGRMGEALVLSILSHLATALVFVATGRALGVPATALDLLIVGNAIVIATLLPVSVGGVGVREGTAVLLLATVGVDPADAALLAVLGYLTAQPPALLGGLLGLAGRSPARHPTRALPVPVADLAAPTSAGGGPLT